MFDIRIARPDDASGIAAVHVSTWRAAYRGLVDDAHLDSLRDEAFAVRWEKILSGNLPDRRHWIAAAGGPEGPDKLVIGFASAGPARDEDLDATGELYALYVSPKRWRKGAGAALLEAALGFLREQGSLRASLWVLAENDRARRFYERMGFTVDGVTKSERYGATERSSVRYVRWLRSEGSRV